MVQKSFVIEREKGIFANYNWCAFPFSDWMFISDVTKYFKINFLLIFIEFFFVIQRNLMKSCYLIYKPTPLI